MAPPQPAVHRTILVVDVEGFGDQSRTNPQQFAVRAALYRALRTAFDRANIPWQECHREDRGDGVFILALAERPKAAFVESLPGYVVEELLAHNNSCAAAERIRLRMALHAGEVNYDAHGVTAASINLAFRLLEAQPLKAALAESPGVLALIASSWFYDEVIRHSSASNPAAYLPVRVTVKETTAVGWICLPDHPFPPHDIKDLPTDLTALVPRQLPTHTPHFVGRDDALRQLFTLLDTARQSGGAVVISAINGTAGIGKTALAVHWARQVADHFPDGQLYVNLRGFDPTGTPMQPAEAIRSFLDAFDIPPGRIPVSLNAQAALYRSLLADRKILVVLDNARDTDHVRPLLPGSATCLVVITSRNQLTGLIAQEGACPIILDVMSRAEATALLGRYLGNDRIAAEPAAAATLIEHCAQLPLALAIMAAQAAMHPGLPLQILAEELQNEQTRLDTLDGGDDSTSMRAVFSWSYQQLSTKVARMFRLLGVHPGADISPLAAANLADVPLGTAREHLSQLTRAHLVTRHVPGRFAFHDLLHTYATERANAEEPEQQRRAAIHRALDFYLHTSFASERQLYPHRDFITLAAPWPGVVPGVITDYRQAMEWFTAEYPTLLAAIDHAARTGLDTYAWQLPWTLATFVYRRGHWHDWAAIHETAVAAATRLGNRAAQATAHRSCGQAYSLLQRHHDALTHLHQALTLYQGLGDHDGQGHTHFALGWVRERQGRHAEALTHGQQALDHFRVTGNPAGTAHALNSVGWYQARLGHHRQALTNCQQAADRYLELGDRDGQAHTYVSLGYAHQHLGHHTRAAQHYADAIALWRELGDHYYEATTLTRLGDTQHALDRQPDAIRAWQQALAILEDLHHPDAPQVRARLDKATGA